MDSKDCLLLEYLARFNEPVEIEEHKVPDEIRMNFQFMGLDKYKYPNSIWVKLFELSTFNLVRHKHSDVWEITETGKNALKSYKTKQRGAMVNEQMVLRYFYKQNKVLAIEDLFQKFGADDIILKPIQYLTNNDWLEELENDALTWKITNEGKAEYERRVRVDNPQGSSTFIITGHGNVINTGVIEGNIQNNIKVLNDLGMQEISKSIGDLMAVVKSANEIQEEQKKEYLETLKVLSDEALKPKEKRLPVSTLKQIIQFGLGTLNTFSSISTITGVTLSNISNFFLNQ